jgi:excisionase family DNA binding protein
MLKKNLRCLQFDGMEIKKQNDEEFYLVVEVAKKLRVSNMTIYRYIKTGKLSAYKFGKEFRISKSEYEYFINKSKV